ncbi:MAG: hypothetical protein F6K30_15490, partial [Cyanothece sp. SIO2G6]|nr:hypothetical protein [Cyanothece sp. SIO2G6]
MYSENENPEDSQLENPEHEYELIKYLTKEDLIEANDAAIRERRNRILRKDFVENLPDDFIYVSPNFFYNNKYEIRLFIVVDDLGNIVLLDVSHLRYNALPTAKLYKDGAVEYESEQEIELKRPYPNKREWQEAFVRKPVRKQ